MAQSQTMVLEETPAGFVVRAGGRILLRHHADAPLIALGRGDPLIAMRQGNFKIEDRVLEKIPLRSWRREGPGRVLFASGDGRLELRLDLESGPDGFALGFALVQGSADRFWLRLEAEPGEAVWGAGEQMSYFDLRGRRFPLWTSEPGVGRDRSTLVTFHADRTSGSGGDYWTTNYPQPTFLSSAGYAVHVETTAYAAFDFRRPEAHEIEVWEAPRRVEIVLGPDLKSRVGALSRRFGRPARLPAWSLGGAILGLKDGARSFERLERFRTAGTEVAGLWCEDWAGVRQTSFGRRLFWDWNWSPERYPDLPRRIEGLRGEGIRFLGYVNPYLCVDGRLYPEAERRGFLALRPDGPDPYVVDFGEFFCGIVDFTRPEASAWFEEEVIGRRMLDVGLSGWMADFGEYLPHDVRLADGTPGMLAHNAWPRIWAEVNARGIDARGLSAEALFFMRAGWTGVQAHCPLLWAGDQSVDFSRHDGLPSVIPAALSSGLLGNFAHHSDIGGYTSLYGNVRTPELLKRWSEFALFTPVMRTHEGNRPDDNLQIDQDPALLAHFARLTRQHARLRPYAEALLEEAHATGLPLQRPLALEFPPDGEDAWTAAEQTSWLYGSDLLAAPVLEAGAEGRRVRLPGAGGGRGWIDLWSGKAHGPGEIEARAPEGRPPAFFREGSPWSDLFRSLAEI